MTADTKDPVDGQELDKGSLDDIEKAHETASHAEHDEKAAAWIPQDDTQYDVTFKTWIVASVRIIICRCI